MGNCASVKNDINLDQAKQLAELQQKDQFAFMLNVLNMSTNKKEFGKYTNKQIQSLVAGLLEANKDKLLHPIAPVVEEVKQEVVEAKQEAEQKVEQKVEEVKQEAVELQEQQPEQEQPEQKQE